MTSWMGEMNKRDARLLTRRGFLRYVGASIGVAAMAFTARSSRAADAPTVTLLYWNHFVPSFNTLLTQQVARWARERGVNARVDLINLPDIPARLASEVQAETGHDIVMLQQQNAQLYKAHLIPMDDVANMLAKEWGPFREPGPYLYRSDGHWVAVPWHYWSDTATINTAHWRAIGFGADNVAALDWEGLAAAGVRLKQNGHPIGIAVSQTGDANDGLYPLLWSYGGRTVNERGDVVIYSKETADSIEFMRTKLFPVFPREVLGWNDASNNQGIYAGTLSWTPNPPSIWALAHLQKMPIESVLDQVPMPRGPHGRFRTAYGVGLGVWQFSRNVALAKDLVHYLASKPQADQQTEASLGYNVPFLAKCAANPFWKSLPVFRYYEPPKEEVRVPGWPGPASKGAALAYFQYIVPLMYAQAVTGRMTTSQAMRWAEDQLRKAYQG